MAFRSAFRSAVAALCVANALGAFRIKLNGDAGPLASLGGFELRRYLYAGGLISGEELTGALRDTAPLVDATPTITLTTSDAAACSTAEVVSAVRANADGYAITQTGTATCITGFDDAGVLQGAYTLLEHLGFFFSSTNPVIPAVARPFPADGFRLVATPAFTTRGLQPFHDFPEGPDWWGLDEQKRVLEAVAQMKGNRIGFHTYPYSPNAGTGVNEPAVWVGLKDQVNPDGTVSSAYTTSWANTLRAEWGYEPINTSAYPFGAASMFDADCFGHETVSGNASLCPYPVSPAAAVDLINAVGAMWQGAFAYAHKIGVATILGTETPLSPPPPGGNSPIPLYVFYSASRNDHFVTTTQCAECNGLYVLLGTIGYVFATQQPGSIAVSTYYSGTYDDNILVTGPPPDATYGFVRVEGYIMPDTSSPGTEALYQYVDAKHHWALTQPWVANATGEGFAQGGVLGGVFTVGVNVTNQDYYEGTFTRLVRLLGDTLDYYWIWTPEAWEWNKVDINNPLVQDVVKDSIAVQAAHDAVGATFQLASCGWVVGPLGDRSYWDSVLPPSWTISSIDMQVGDAPVDPAYLNITHRDAAHKWVIPWAEDDPGLTAPELWLNRTLLHAADAIKYGCGGLMMIHWRTRMTSPQIGAALAVAWNTSLTSADYWASWADAQFGPDVGPSAAPIFSAVESFNLPRPVNWVSGPGTMTASSGMCNWATVYAFVDSLGALRAPLLASIAAGRADLNALERFDYWLQQFVYMRGIARMECDWAAYNAVIASIQAIKNRAQQMAAAFAQGIPARISLVQNVSTMMYDLIATVSTTEGFGTVFNALTQSMVNSVGPGPTALLTQLAGQALPAAALLPKTYDPLRAPQIEVPIVRSMLEPGEPLRLRAVVLTTPSQAPVNVTLYTATLGSSSYTATPLTGAGVISGVARYVFSGVSAPPGGADFQWYVEAILPGNTTAYTNGVGIPAGTSFVGGGSGGVVLRFPATAPAKPQTVVVMPAA